MAFDNLSSRLQMGLRRLTGKGKLNENDIDDLICEYSKRKRRFGK